MIRNILESAQSAVRDKAPWLSSENGRLSNRNIEIVCMRCAGHTLEEVGRKHGVSRERVAQIVRDVTRTVTRCAKIGLISDPNHDELDADVVVDDRVKFTDHLVDSGEAERETRNMYQAIQHLGKAGYIAEQGWTLGQATNYYNSQDEKLRVVPEVLDKSTLAG